MPANLTPEYLQAEEDFRKATTIEEKIEALQRMLALLPKHKGTERIQADIKRRLAKLKEMEQQQRAKRGGTADPFYIPRHGAGQVVAIGFANVGKSALLSALSGVPLEVADYPYTTQRPQPRHDALRKFANPTGGHAAHHQRGGTCLCGHGSARRCGVGHRGFVHGRLL